METTIPAELLDLKNRLDQWRANRKYLREPLPAELQQAVGAISRRYSGTLLRRVLKIDPWRLNRSMAKKSTHAGAPTSSPLRVALLPSLATLPDDTTAVRRHKEVYSCDHNGIIEVEIEDEINGFSRRYTLRRR